MYLVQQSNHIGLLEFHLHHSLVYLAEVHQLVDKTLYALSVALHQTVLLLSYRVFIGSYEFLQWRHDERHWCADVVADVHKELYLGLVQLLGMYVLLQAQPLLFLAATLAHNIPNQCCGQQRIDEVSPYRGIPCRMHHDGELPLVRTYLVITRPHSKMICARGEVAECHLAHSVTQTHPVAIVDAVFVNHLLGEGILHCRETQCKRVVGMVEVEALGINDCGVNDVIYARLHAHHHLLLGGAHLNQMNSHLLLALQDVLVAEESDTVVATKDKTPLVETRRTVGELVTLQAIAHAIVHEGLLLDVHVRESTVGAYP